MNQGFEHNEFFIQLSNTPMKRRIAPSIIIQCEFKLVKVSE